MECYHCGSRIARAMVCPVCGSDLRDYVRFMDVSETLYNRGLRQARERNLYGAAESLKLALQYNKVNIKARNLLGLVYYERGEATLAIREWLISKGFQPENNLANDYLEDTDRNSIERERINQTSKKYNIIIAHLRNEAYDLAAIQLKKVLSLSPNFIKARQIQALLLMRDGRYEAAISTLEEAIRTDGGDPLCLLYLKEARQKKGDARPKAQATQISSGNDYIIQPRHSKSHGVINVILNFIIGVGIGAAIVWYLAVPSIKRSAAGDANAITLQSNETISTKNQQIKALEEEISALNEQLDGAGADYDALLTAIDAYDNLVNAFRYYANANLDMAGKTLDAVDVSLLSETGKKYYSNLSDDILAVYLEQTYEAANKAYNGSNVTGAAEYYESVVSMDETYDEGNAIYNLAQCYRKAREYEKAVQYYTRVTELFPDSYLSSKAEIYINQLSRYL